jgi:hypothetical protein
VFSSTKLRKGQNRFCLEVRGVERKGRSMGEKWPKQCMHIRINEIFLKRIGKCSNIYTVEYYLAIKRNKILTRLQHDKLD